MLKKILILTLLTLLLINIVSANTFLNDTSISQGDVTYVFRKGVSINNFQFFNGGVMLNNDALYIRPAGGHLTIYINEWKGVENNSISLLSNVPQKIFINLKHNDQEYYFYDGVTYNNKEYSIGTNLINGSFKQLFNNTNNNVDVITDLKDNKDWFHKNSFNIIYDIDYDNEHYVAKTLNFKNYYWLIILGLIILWILKRLLF